MTKTKEEVVDYAVTKLYCSYERHVDDAIDVMKEVRMECGSDEALNAELWNEVKRRIREHIWMYFKE